MKAEKEGVYNKNVYLFYTTLTEFRFRDKKAVRFWCDTTHLPNDYWIGFVKNINSGNIDTLFFQIENELFSFLIRQVIDVSTSWLNQAVIFDLRDKSGSETSRLLQLLRTKRKEDEYRRLYWILPEKLKCLLLEQRGMKNCKEIGETYLYLLSFEDIDDYVHKKLNQ